MATAYGQLPLSFEENRGQAKAGVRFIARGPGHALSLGPNGALLELSAPAHARGPRGPHARENVGTDTTIVRMSLTGSNPTPTLTARNRLAGTTSHFAGRDPSRWHTAIPTYATVQYDAVYPGVDLVYHGNHRELEFDFVLAPQADPAQIALDFTGTDAVTLADDGTLQLHAAGHQLVQRRPVAYQEVDGERRPVASRYVRRGHAIGFELGAYDTSRPLVIDPVLAYSTYYGGTGGDVGTAVAVDPAGNVYVTGTTDAGGSNSRLFVSKFNAAGTTELYSAFIYEPGCDSLGGGIAVDASGQAHLAGQYGGLDQFGLCNANGAFTAKLDAAGTAFVYSYATGTDDKANAVALDAQGNAYFTGRTRGDWPVTSGAFQTTAGAGSDAFVLALDPAGNLRYSTYLGGSVYDEGFAIAVDAQHNAVVTGAAGLDFPTTANAYSRTAGNPTVSCFVTRFNASGSGVLYSTLLSGAQGESCTGVALDGLGKVYVTGSTTSFNFPVVPPGGAYDTTCGTDGLCNAIYTCSGNLCDYQYGEDVFVAKIDPTVSGRASLVYSTFVGGENRDLAEALVVDGSGHVYVTGRTASRSYPLAGPLQPTFGGDFDVFVTELNATGTGVPFSTYLGGDGHEIGRGVALDGAGHVYVTGDTASTNFPTRGALRGALSGPSDAFITAIDVTAAPPPTTTVASLGLNPATVVGGAGSTGTLMLTGAAPAGGLVVALASSHAVATVPPSVTVPAGAASATFAVTSQAVTTATAVTIAASGAGVTRTSTLTVVPPAGQAPGAPTAISARVDGNVVSVSWSPPLGGAPVSGYALDAGTSSGASNVAANVVVGNVLSVTTAVPVGTYFVRVRAFNQFGAGPSSSDAPFTIGGTAPPGVPRALAVSVAGATVSLSWTVPASGGAPTDYVVEAGSSPGASNIAAGVPVGNQLALSATVPAGAYYVRVRARNAAGTSAPSNEVLAQVGGAGGVPEAPRNLSHVAANGHVQLRWDPPASGAVPSDYVIEAGSSSGASDVGVFPVGNVTSLGVDAGNVTVFVRVRARNAAGAGAPSNERLIVSTRTTP